MHNLEYILDFGFEHTKYSITPPPLPHTHRELKLLEENIAEMSMVFWKVVVSFTDASRVRILPYGNSAPFHDHVHQSGL